VELCGATELHAAFREESRTSLLSTSAALQQIRVGIGLCVVFFQGKLHPRISCTRQQATTACAAFIEESRMKFINANNLRRKSGHLAIFVRPP
jgi:hypothetical protein